ncbi:Wd Repeat And Fyve Domain-Containing Protein 3 [Manis pentadactyla]|nr:Wd Repeat And Fyve Domain-Containing Protein 3 [Manis pentadactyla]
MSTGLENPRHLMAMLMALISVINSWNKGSAKHFRPHGGARRATTTRPHQGLEMRNPSGPEQGWDSKISAKSYWCQEVLFQEEKLPKARLLINAAGNASKPTPWRVFLFPAAFFHPPPHPRWRDLFLRHTTQLGCPQGDGDPAGLGDGPPPGRALQSPQANCPQLIKWWFCNVTPGSRQPCDLLEPRVVPLSIFPYRCSPPGELTGHERAPQELCCGIIFPPVFSLCHGTS